MRIYQRIVLSVSLALSLAACAIDVTNGGIGTSPSDPVDDDPTVTTEPVDSVEESIYRCVERVCDPCGSNSDGTTKLCCSCACFERCDFGGACDPICY